MANASSLKGLLETATSLIDAGTFAEAEAILQRLAADPDCHVLGPDTAARLPRRLHSALLKLAKRRGNAADVIALQYDLVPPVELLRPLFHVDAAERQRRVAMMVEMVPTVLHQVWIGSAPPETTEIWRDHADRHAWTYKLWDETALASIGVNRDPVFRAMLDRDDLPGAVDVARYQILANEGGLYLDCDWVPVGDQPFEAVIPLRGLSAMAEKTPRRTGVGSAFLNNSVIAAPPGHPVFEQLLHCLPAVLERLPKGPAWWVTGPLVFTLASRGGPICVLDAGLSEGETVGERAEVDAAVAALSGAGSPTFLHAWKPWVVR